MKVEGRRSNSIRERQLHDDDEQWQFVEFSLSLWHGIATEQATFVVGSWALTLTLSQTIKDLFVLCHIWFMGITRRRESFDAPQNGKKENFGAAL